MTNLFNFDYEVQKLHNKDNSESRFAVVYGENGNIIHTKKDSYSIIGTEDFSRIGNAFINDNYNVSTFVEKSGEVIGLNIDLLRNQAKPTEVGDKIYRAIITVPNNGGGKGYLSIHETRLICSNGMTRTKALNEQFSVKIPHTLNYKIAIDVMTKALQGFMRLVEYAENFDSKLNNQKLENDIEAIKLLNRWFWECEFPTSQKGDMTFDDFRKELALNPENIKCIDRYNQLKNAFKRELTYNDELGLDLSIYTVFATVNNYLTRRIEASKSVASEETQFQRAEVKTQFFNQFVTI